MDRATAADLRMLRAQLGRAPRGVDAVPVCCGFGYPQVIRVHPVVEGKPFPTLFWLTCPFLRHAVDRLEATGEVKRLEALLERDERLRADLDEARRWYVAERVDALTEEERGLLYARGMLRALSDRGIGGIADPKRVKCLHLHVAHALVDKNPIGELILARLGILECPPEDVICSAREDGADQPDQPIRG